MSGVKKELFVMMLLTLSIASLREVRSWRFMP